MMHITSHVIRATSIGLLVASGLGGCNKESSPTLTSAPSTATATPTAAPTTAGSLIGKWKATAIEGGESLPADLLKDLISATLDLHADNTFRARNNMAGGFSGTWTLDGSTITLNLDPAGSALLIKSRAAVVDGDKLKEKSDTLITVYERLPADAGKPQFKMTVADYLADLKKDESALKTKYLGKIIELNGVVDQIMTNFGGDSFVMVSAPPPPGAEESGPVVACFTIDREPFAHLGPGQTVTIRGEVSDTVMMPRVVEAEIVQTGPPTLVTIGAEDLAQEFAKDPEATAKKYTARKYTGKSILLTGSLLTTKPNSSGDPANVIVGSADANATCIFGTEKAVMDKIKAMKPGDPIKLVGVFDTLTTSGKSPELHQCLLVTGK